MSIKTFAYNWLKKMEDRKKDPCYSCGVRYVVNCKATNNQGALCEEKKRYEEKKEEVKSV